MPLSKSSCVNVNVFRRGFLGGNSGGRTSRDALDGAVDGAVRFLGRRPPSPRLEELVDACELSDRWDTWRDVCAVVSTSVNEAPSSSVEFSVGAAAAAAAAADEEVRDNELVVDERDEILDRLEAPAKDHLARALVSFFAGLKLPLVTKGAGAYSSVASYSTDVSPGSDTRVDVSLG